MGDLDLEDIQGNVLAGFNTDIQVLVALTATSSASLPSCARWAASLSGEVATVAQVKAQRDFMKEASASPSSTWLAVAVGHRLLTATQPDLRLGDNAFGEGMIQHARGMLGDFTDPAGWKAGPTPQPIDILLIVASNNETAATARARDLSQSAAASGASVTYQEIGRRLTGEQEHFGFRDGVSQPSVAGFEASLGQGMSAGHFVFGYPREAGGSIAAPVVDTRKIAENGSLLVFRRLNQDVAKFHNFLQEEATRLAVAWPGMRKEYLGALLVGRWPSGAPLRSGELQDPGIPSTGPDNDFSFSDDRKGAVCPLGAHIRKVHPRGGDADVTARPRMLRRGIPFEEPATAPHPARGLLFLAYQTSIDNQFEFLTQHWMNSEINPARGQDLLVGRSVRERKIKLLGPAGPVEVSDGRQQWITPTGGAYLFAPGKRGLAKLAQPPSSLGLWKARAIAEDVRLQLRGLMRPFN